MSKKLTEKQRKEILAQRWQDVKEKLAGRKRTEKEIFDDEKIWEEH